MADAYLRRPGLVMLGIVIAQNLRRLRQVRTLVVLLKFSGMATTVKFTAWQYSYGVGVKLVEVPGTTPLIGPMCSRTISSIASRGERSTRQNKLRNRNK